MDYISSPDFDRNIVIKAGSLDGDAKPPPVRDFSWSLCSNLLEHCQASSTSFLLGIGFVLNGMAR